MRSLNAQFDSALDEAFALHEKSVNEISEQLKRGRQQQAILTRLISDYRHKDDLIEHVLKRLGEGVFQDGDDALLFFCKCADELFIMALRDLPINEQDQYKKMRKLHPLWGESWWSK